MNYLIEEDEALKLSVFKFCFYITLGSNLVIFITQPLNITILESLASRCFMLSNLLAFFFSIYHSLRKFIPYKTKQIVTIFFMICFSFLSYLLSNESGLYQYIIRIWCYLALPFYLLYVDYLKPDKRMIHTIFFVNILISIVYILLSLSKYSYMGYEKFIGTNNAWLTLGYDNPNQTAMYLVINLIVLLCSFHYVKKRSIQLVIVLFILYIGVLLIKTSSRTCILIGAIIFFIDLIKRNFKISKVIVIGMLFLPFVFMLIYPFLYKHNLLYFFSFGGKTDYESRSQIFQSVLNQVGSNFLFGKFGKYQLQNLHNGTLSVYASIGLVGLVLFYIFYIRAYLKIISNGIKSKVAFISLLGLLSVFLHACTEGAFLVGGSVFAGSLSVLIYLTKFVEKGVEKN